MPVHVSSTCAHHQGPKLHYTASGIITPVGGCLVHRLREDSKNYCKTKMLCIKLVNYWDKKKCYMHEALSFHYYELCC